MSNEQTTDTAPVTTDVMSKDKVAIVTVKVSDRIKACTDIELNDYEDNLKDSNKYHNLELSKFKAMTGAEFGVGLHKKFIEGGIFKADQFGSFLKARYDSSTGEKLDDKEVFYLNQFRQIKTNHTGNNLLRSHGRKSRLTPILVLDKELEDIEVELETCTNLPSYKATHAKYKDVITQQDKIFETLQNDKNLMKDSKESQKIENELNLRAFKRLTFKHRFSTSLNNLKLLAIEGEQSKRTNTINEFVSARTASMRATFKAMLE